METTATKGCGAPLAGDPSPSWPATLSTPTHTTSHMDTRYFLFILYKSGNFLSQPFIVSNYVGPGLGLKH